MPACSEERIERLPVADNTFRRRMAGNDRSALARPRRTAQRSNQPLGSAEVAHPFHPLRGQRFVVLKVRRISGVETLSLRHPDLGSFAMPREWTNWAPPGEQTSAGAVPLLIDAFGLTALAELMASIAQGQFEVDR
jgi:Family of unknown function (DUF5372)